MRHAVGITSSSRRVCTGCISKIIDGQSRLNRRISRVRFCPCNNVQTLTTSASLAPPATAAHPTHGGRLRVPCRTPLPGARPARGGRLSHRLKSRGSAARPPTALNGNPVRCRSFRTDTSRTCASAMRYEVRSGVAGRDPTCVRRVRLRHRFADRAEHRESDHYAPHGNPHRCARSLIRPCAVFRWSVAPLRHHHFKFLRWPRSRRASSAYPQDPRRDSTDSDALSRTTTTLDTWRMQFFLLGRSIAIP